MTRAIGIDLGTTYSLLATIEGGKARVIPNAEGHLLTPSVVTFTSDGKPVVGEPAKAQAALNPQGTVFSIKRRMGSDYRVRIGPREYTPPELSAFILRKVKDDAESYLGESIERAVISIPAYFNDRQREATRQAGALAGLEVMRIINEPTAAALAYGLEREEVHTVLVWDLGGGTFDVSILELGEGIFEVRAVSGDTWLGGDDFDQHVMDYLMAQYRRTWGVDFPEDLGARQRLWEVAERAKAELSSRLSTQIRVPLADLPPLETELTRGQLESLTTDLLQRMEPPTEQALSDAGLSPSDIDRVILVGGSTRMPAVRQLARKLLGKEPYRYIDPDQVVALGAAIQAGMLLGLVEKAVLLDVLPLSLGVEVQGGLMAWVIPRNTPLPATEGRIFTTAADYQTSMDIHVLQGERTLAVDNISLGQFQLDGIPPARRGVPRVEMAFHADVDGIVHVSARELWAEREVKVKVVSSKLLDPGEAASLIDEAQRAAQQDQERRQQVEAAIQGENLVAAAEATLKERAQPGPGEGERPLADPEMRPLLKALAHAKEALAGGTTEEIRARSAELRQLLASLAEGKASIAASTPRG